MSRFEELKRKIAAREDILTTNLGNIGWSGIIEVIARFPFDAVVLDLEHAGTKGAGFTMHLLRAESPGPDVGKLVPQMRKTAAILYIIYCILTLLDIVFLLLGDMSLFESVCHAYFPVPRGPANG